MDNLSKYWSMGCLVNQFCCETHFDPYFLLIASVPQMEPVFFQSGFPPPCCGCLDFIQRAQPEKKIIEFSVANWEGLSIPNWALCCFCSGFDYGLNQITTIEYVLALFPGIEQANPENGTCLRLNLNLPRRFFCAMFECRNCLVSLNAQVPLNMWNLLTERGCNLSIRYNNKNAHSREWS